MINMNVLKDQKFYSSPEAYANTVTQGFSNCGPSQEILNAYF